MIRLAPFFLLLMFLLPSGCSSPYPHATPNALGRSVFAALQSHDRSVLNRFLPTRDDMLAVLEDARMSPGKKVKAVRRMTRNWDETHRAQLAQIDADWDALYSQASDDGVELSLTTLKSVEHRFQEKKGVSVADIDVFLMDGDATYRIRLDNCMSSPRGWLLSEDGFRWRGRVM